MSLTAEMVGLTKKLIEFESIESKPGELEAIIDFAEDYLRKNTKLYLKRFEVNGKHSLVGTFKKDHPPRADDPFKTPEIFFHDHLDVVPGDPAQFKPFIKGNKLYGRGASDTKGNGAVLLVLAKELSKLSRGPSASSGRHLPNVGFMFTTDEEIGGQHGTKFHKPHAERALRCDLVWQWQYPFFPPFN